MQKKMRHRNKRKTGQEFRHAKLAHKAGAPLEQIQLSLGHQSLKTTEIYLGIDQDFQKWRNGEIDGFELNGLIHRYHQEASREVWKSYDYLDLYMIVSRAVAQGLLKKEEIQEDIFELIDTRIDFFSCNDESE